MIEVIERHNFFTIRFTGLEITHRLSILTEVTLFW
jgi:hypothetical protein